MGGIAAHIWFIAMWPFASPWMLLWAAVAVVPILIHLWSRRKYDEVPWAAMRFLLAAIRKNARRLRLEQLLLLVTRVLILVLLALALADPIVALYGNLGNSSLSGGDTHTVLIVDGSYSMDYRLADATRFDLAKTLASELVRQSVQGDGFTLLLLAAPPRVVVSDPVFDRESMVAEITQLQRTDGGANLIATLAEAEKILQRTRQRETRLRRERICFFTDLGRNTWGDVTSGTVQTLLARLAEKNVQLQLYDLGQSGGQNVAVTRLGADEGLATVGSPIRLEMEFENFGTQDRTRQDVQLFVDGQAIAEFEVDIAAGGRANLSAVHRFQMPGEHIIEARLREDRLVADNRRWLSLTVRASLEVLCIEGKSGAAHNVALALEPSTELQTHVHVVVRSEIALLEENLGNYDCVFLCNVGRFGRDEAQLLKRYLEKGGGVVFFLGDQVQAANYNAILGPDARSARCFSVHLDKPVPLGEYHFDPLDYQHPIVAPFRGHERAGLLTTPIWKYVRATVPANGAAVVALRFQNKDPAIVEEPLGSGRVVLALTDGSSVSLDRSTSPPTPWSALAAWPSFPPLVQQMMRAAVRGRVQLRNALVGEALRGTLPTGSSETSVVVTDPAMQTQRIPVRIDADTIRWTFTETSLGGVYTVSLQQDREPRQQFAVNLDTRESRLDRFDADLLPKSIRQETTPDDQPTPSVEVAKPAPIFRYLLAAVLVLLLCETLLASSFNRAP